MSRQDQSRTTYCEKHGYTLDESCYGCEADELLKREWSR